MEAQLVRKAVNRCAAQGKPFLFGVDFELREGFFVENPLVCRQIPFACGEITNVPDSFSGERKLRPAWRFCIPIGRRIFAGSPSFAGGCFAGTVF